MIYGKTETNLRIFFLFFFHKFQFILEREREREREKKKEYVKRQNKQVNLFCREIRYLFVCLFIYLAYIVKHLNISLDS